MKVKSLSYQGITGKGDNAMKDHDIRKQLCMTVPFMQDADNVYRTKNYIVRQQLQYCQDEFGTAVIMSNDTFFRRSLTRDFLYEELFLDKGAALDGKRIHSATYTRMYVE